MKWTSAPNDTLLLEAGYSHTRHITLLKYRPEVEAATCFTASSTCGPGTSYGDIAKQDLVLNRFWNAASSGPGFTAPASQPAMSRVIVGSLSHVTGAHNFKVGFQHRFGWADSENWPNGDLRQQYQNGRPFQVLIFNTPIDGGVDVNADFGLYVQDTWTMKRLTISPGLRFDYFNSSIPDQSAPPGRFVPARHFSEVTDVPNWTDVSPRFGVSYDLFGNGKTAIKGMIGKYVQSEGPGFASTYNPLLFSGDTRSWTDVNGDDVAQENEIGPPSDLTFGVRRNQNPDPDLERPYQIVGSVSLHQEMFPGLGVAVTYTQREYERIIWTDNLAIAPFDYILLTIADPRGNGELLPVYSIRPAVFGHVDEFDTTSTNSNGYKGIDVTFNARLRGGATFYGGVSTGRSVSNICQVEDPNTLPGIRFCDAGEFDIPLRTSFSLTGSYPLPYDARVSFNFRTTPGSERELTYLVSRAQLPQLTQPSVTVRLNEPGTEFNDRVTQLDLMLTKHFRMRSVNVRPEVGIFNLLNANPVLTQTNAYGPALNNVISILDARLVRLGLTVSF